MMKFVVRLAGEERAVEVSRVNGRFRVVVDGESYDVDSRHFGDTEYRSLMIGNESFTVESGAVDASEGRYYARVLGRHYDVDVLDELMRAVRDAEAVDAAAAGATLRSPMPGVIVDVKVQVGDVVTVGTPLVVMEAMKMQNELTAESDGVVEDIKVSPGDTVETQAVLVVLRANDE